MTIPDLKSCEKILILCPIGIGNYLMVQPAIENLNKQLGKKKLYLLALKPGIAQMAQDSQLFENVIQWYPDSESIITGLKTIAHLRAHKFDASISLFPTGHWKYSLFSLLIGAQHRVGFSYPNSRIPIICQNYTITSDPKLHDTEQNLKMVNELLGASKYLGYTFPGAQNLKTSKIEEPFFVCHPGSSAERGMDKKRFPPKVFAALINALYSEYGLKCYLAGDASEANLREEISRSAPKACIDFSCSSLKELSGILQQSQFYLGNDSGLMHMSVAAKKRCIVLFGPTSEKRTGPYAISNESISQEHLIIRDTSLTCAPCWDFSALGKNKPCKYGDYRCTAQYDPMTDWDSVKFFVESLSLK